MLTDQRVNVGKMAILPKVIYVLNSISAKILGLLFTDAIIIIINS